MFEKDNNLHTFVSYNEKFHKLFSFPKWCFRKNLQIASKSRCTIGGGSACLTSSLLGGEIKRWIDLIGKFSEGTAFTFSFFFPDGTVKMFLLNTDINRQNVNFSKV